jgi:hypothetical protein
MVADIYRHTLNRFHIAFFFPIWLYSQLFKLCAIPIGRQTKSTAIMCRKIRTSVFYLKLFGYFFMVGGWVVVIKFDNKANSVQLNLSCQLELSLAKLIISARFHL